MITSWTSTNAFNWLPVVPDQALVASSLTPFQAVLAGDVSAVDTQSFYQSFSRNLPHAVAANSNGNLPENASDLQIGDPNNLINAPYLMRLLRYQFLIF